MKLNWRQGILFITTTGMEGCWLYALITLLNEKLANGSLSAFGLLIFYPLSFGFNKLLRRLCWPQVFILSLSWLAWAVVTLLMVKIQLFGGLAWINTTWLLAIPRAITEVVRTFRPELLIVISTGILWWLGWRLTYLRGNFTALVNRFQFGLVILVITFFTASQLHVSLTHPVLLTMVFFLFALLGMSLAHAMEGTSWLSGLYRGHWFGLLLTSICLILVLGLLISSLITPDLLQLFLIPIKWVWGLFLKALHLLANLFPQTEIPELLPTTPMSESELAEAARVWRLSDALRENIGLGWAILMIGLMLLALWRISASIFGWLRRKLASMAGAEFEALPGAFRADFFGLLKRILSRLLKLRLPFRIGLRPRVILPEIASVRRIYRQLLLWAAAGGYPRHLSQTPQEYSYVLVRLLPEAQWDLDLITQQYVRTRYGTSLPADDEIHQLVESWHRVRRNRLKQARKGIDENRGTILNG
jgi:hypothetical protein